jgi:hypothetical protein
VNSVGDRLLDLEALGLRFTARQGKVIARGDIELLTQSDRNWVDEHRVDLINLLELPQIEPEDETDAAGNPIPFPLATAQMGPWTGARDPASYPNVCRLTISFSVAITGRLDLDRLRRAVDILLLRHPQLRARIDRHEPVQTFWPDPIPIEQRTAQDVSDENLARQLSDLEAAPFEVFGGCLTRITLLRLGPYAHILQFACNHIILDGWSTNLLRRDIEHAYQVQDDASIEAARLAGRQFLGYLRWLDSSRLQARRRLAMGRWRRWLSDLPEGGASLRLDRARSQVNNDTDGLTKTMLGEGVGDAVRSRAASLNVTPGAVASAGLLLLLARQQRTDFPIFLMLDSGRWRPELAELCGLFLTNVPVSARIRPDDTTVTFLERVHRTLVERRAEPCGWPEFIEIFERRPGGAPERLCHISLNILQFDISKHTDPAAERRNPQPVRNLASAESSAIPQTTFRHLAVRSRFMLDKVRFFFVPRRQPQAGIPGDISLNVSLEGPVECIWDYNSRVLNLETIVNASDEYKEIIMYLCASQPAPLNNILTET